MALSKQTLDYLLEAEGSIRSAIKSAAVNEKPLVVTQISKLLYDIESLKEFDDLQKENILGVNKFGQEGDNIYSDGTLQILSNSLVPKFQVVFNDLFPYSLSTISFDATDTDTEYFTAEVSFKYTIYNLTDLENNLL